MRMASRKHDTQGVRVPEFPSSSRWRPVLLLLLVVVLTVSYNKITPGHFSPGHIWSAWAPESFLSLDQRAERILSHTPLIGEHDYIAFTRRVPFADCTTIQTATSTWPRDCVQSSTTTSTHPTSLPNSRKVACPIISIFRA